MPPSASHLHLVEPDIDSAKDQMFRDFKNYEQHLCPRKLKSLLKGSFNWNASFFPVPKLVEPENKMDIAKRSRD